MESVYTTWGWLPHDDGHAPASFFSHMVYMGAALTGQGGLTGVKAAPGSGPGRPFWGVSQPQEGGEALRHLLENPAARARAARNIARHCREGGYAGCSLSIQAPLPHQRDNLSALVEETAWQLRQAGLALAVEVLGRTRDPQNAGSAGADGGPSPADWADLYDYMTLGVYTDYFILHAGDLPHGWRADDRPGSDGSIPSPRGPATWGWLQAVVDYALESVPPRSLVLSLPVYGRIWRPAGQGWRPGEPVPAAQVGEIIAREVGDALPEAAWDDVGRCRRLTMLRAVGFYEDQESLPPKAELVVQNHLAGAAFWRPGLEAPGLWRALAPLLGVKD